MQVLGTLGFVFGLIAFTTVNEAKKQIEDLTREVDTLKKQVQELTTDRDDQ